MYTLVTTLKRRTEAMFTVAIDEHDCEGEERRDHISMYAYVYIYIWYTYILA